MSTLTVTNITGVQSDDYVDTKIAQVNANNANTIVTAYVYSLAF
jgi:hypothetical protein